MKSILSGVDLRYIVKELQPLCNDAKIDQLYVYDAKNIAIRLYIKNKGKKYLRVELPGLLYLSEHNPPAPQIPPSITLFLRKILAGAIITKVRQVALERTCYIHTMKTGVERIIVCELFDKGNILVLENGIIRGCLEQQSWSTRIVRPGEKYIPVQKQTSLLDADISPLIATIEPETVLSRALATNFGLGGEFASELCARNNLDPHHPCSRMSSQQWSALRDALLRMLEENSPRIYCAKGTMLTDAIPPKEAIYAVTPVAFTSLADHPSVQQPSFNEAVDRAFGGQKILAVKQVSVKESEKKISGTQKILASLQAQEEQLLRTIDECTSVGQYIYEHYPAIDKLLKESKLSEKSGTMDVFLEKYPMLKYDPKHRTIAFATNEKN